MAELVMLDVPSNLGTELMAPPVVVVTGALCAHPNVARNMEAST
jgi:hypothetical protein